ncbi:MAG: hypothetical protein D3904_08380 [Candidatus Electrothrix sp. EH2]|nr:hypothetical protein [Candidatus Electrothrix sp. EH2]
MSISALPRFGFSGAAFYADGRILTTRTGMTGFYNTASALLYLFIIGANEIRTEITRIHKFGHSFLLSAAILSYIER